jgi:hypothetical protein
MAGFGLVTFAVVIVLEIAVAIINTFTRRGLIVEYPHLVLYLAAVVGFIGFYGMSPTRAREGGDFILTAGERIVAIVRTGIPRRRSTDTPVVVTTTDETAVVITPPPPDLHERGP